MCSHGKFAPKQGIQRNLRCLLGSGWGVERRNQDFT
jgi:hypothetical protein